MFYLRSMIIFELKIVAYIQYLKNEKRNTNKIKSVFCNMNKETFKLVNV